GTSYRSPTAATGWSASPGAECGRGRVGPEKADASDPACWNPGDPHEHHVATDNQAEDRLKWTRPGRGVRGNVLDGGGRPARARGASRGSWASSRPARRTKPGVTACWPPRSSPAGSSTAQEPRPGSSPFTRTPTRSGERARVTRPPYGLVAVAPSGDRPARSG